MMIFLSLQVTADAVGGLKGPTQLRRSLRGLGGGGHQQARAGIYRRIACHYYRTLVLHPMLSANLLLQSIKFRGGKELSKSDFKAIT